MATSTEQLTTRVDAYLDEPATRMSFIALNSDLVRSLNAARDLADQDRSDPDIAGYPRVAFVYELDGIRVGAFVTRFSHDEVQRLTPLP